jgi:peptidoglycan L-alanyl-D-glutamate endopeptidase CwlK
MSSTEPTTTPAVAPTLHVVSAGETLILIAKRHGVTLHALLASNEKITNPDRIQVGEKITIPLGRVTSGGTPEPSRSAVVAAGTSSAFAEMDKRNKTGALHPIFRERLAMLGNELARRGMKALITDGLRTFEEQENLFQIGRRGIAGERIVTKAHGGESNHNYGLAVDMYPVLTDSAGRARVFTDIPEDASIEFSRAFNRTQNAIGEQAEALGLFWGARFTGIVDTPHIQLLAEHVMNARKCLEIFRNNGERLQAVWDEASRRVAPLTT